MPSQGKKWVCEGVTHNGQQPSNQNPVGRHEPYENYGYDCVICGLTREQVIPQRRLPVKGIAIAAGIVALLGVGSLVVSGGGGCPEGQEKTDGVCQEIGESGGDEPDEPPKPSGGNFPEENSEYYLSFSRGQRTLFTETSNPPRDEGIELFKQQKYQEAADSFKRAVEGDQNNPELLIFYNNALARQKGEPFTLAVVVPVDSRRNSAKEMLRGVAQAQNQFNAKGGRNSRLLEILIVNDGNEPKKAASVAEELIKDDSILGVIGHNSSNASKSGLVEYEQAGLAMISPTSTSTALSSDVFFRTVPSDAAAGQKLAQYVYYDLYLTKAVIFYNPNSSFSNSLRQAFESEFIELGGELVGQQQGTTDIQRGLKDISNSSFNASAEINASSFEDQAEVAVLIPNADYTSVAIEIARANSNLPKGQRLKLVGGDSLYSADTLTAGGKSVEGLVLAIAWFAGTPEAQNFKKAGEQQWGGIVNWRTAMSFDATQALIEAFSENATRSGILENLKQVNISENETSGKELGFTPEGERQSDPVLVEVVRDSNNKVPGSEFGYELVP